MTSPDWLHFFERMYPSANMVLVRGDHPVLVDTGFGSDFPETERLLKDAGVPPQQLSLIVNTHYHCDHVMYLRIQCGGLRGAFALFSGPGHEQTQPGGERASPIGLRCKRMRLGRCQ